MRKPGQSVVAGVVAGVVVGVVGWLCACGESPPPANPAPNPPASASLAAASTPSAPPPLPSATASTPATTPAPTASATVTPVPLPGATGNVSLDYLACDRPAGRVWVPAGATGSVDVLDVKTKAFTRIEGFPTAERPGGRGKRVVGPSAVAVGGGFAFIGNRATAEVCPVDATSLLRGKCLKLPSPTDGVAYVAMAKEVWVTTPKDQTMTILDASTPSALKSKTVVKLDGAPEGYAVDEAHGLFFTNLEDKGGTVVIDVKTHKVTATWNAGCGSDGPRGLAFDAGHDFLLVACTDHVQALDAAHGGAKLGTLDAGAGIDNLDFLDAGARLYVAAGKAGKLTVAHVDEKGQLSLLATVSTSDGARNAVADADGNAYLADSAAGRVLVVSGIPAKP